MDRTLSCEVVVVGGGPAGATAASLLARWGHDVVVAAGRRRTNPLAETLPPSTRSILERTSQLELVDRAGFLAARGTTVRWGGQSHSTRFGEQSGWQVSRDLLDAVLLEGAEAAGARVLRDAFATAVEPADQKGPARATVAAAPGPRTVTARWVIDATGRAGILASHGNRIATSPPTVALAQLWRHEKGWPLEDPNDTTVESYAGGWVWSIPAYERVRCFAAMVDRDSDEPARAASAAARHRRELERTDLHRRLLAGAAPIGRAWVCGATSYRASRAVGPGWISVGDAGSFLDPLSSYGVKKAISSAWLGAVALHTALIRPEMTSAALELHDAREREAAGHYERGAAGFHALAATAHPGPFWSRRATPPLAAEDPGIALVPDGRVILADPAVRRAYEELRASERIRLRPARGVARVKSPAVRGSEIVLEERVTSPSAPHGLGMFRGVDLPALVDTASDPADVPDLMEAYARRRGPVALPDFLAGLSVLLATGMLENEAANMISNGGG